MAIVLALMITCTVLFIELKTERDAQEILNAKLVGRYLRCP
jgi:hypothetical protein